MGRCLFKKIVSAFIVFYVNYWQQIKQFLTDPIYHKSPNDRGTLISE